MELQGWNYLKVHIFQDIITANLDTNVIKS